MNIKRRLLVFLLSALTISMAFVPVDDNPIGKIVSSLARWSEANPQEKIYLHTDKPYYAVGDTIWFKAYVTVGARHKPTTLSGAMYVDLINEKDSVTETLKLAVRQGVSAGDFVLGDLLEEGNYRLRAYTQWMRNAGESRFYEHPFFVGNGYNEEPLIKGKSSAKTAKTNTPSPVVELKNVVLENDIQFFPEGGVLLNQVSSKVAFKAVGSNGSGIDMKGVLLDDQNRVVLEFASEHLGMGSFNFMPQRGRGYTAKITFADGSERRFELPKARESGHALSITEIKDSLIVRIDAAGQGMEQTGLGLIATSGTETIYAAEIASGRKSISLSLPKNKFPTGIARFSLFGGNGEPLNERIVFVKNKDRMEVKVNPVNEEFKIKERVVLELVSNDQQGKAVSGNFSVAVLDLSKVTFDADWESTIFSNLLLSSDLKGAVEKPNYYFRDMEGREGTVADINRHLDNLMLTQGYSGFSWKEVTRVQEPTPTYQPEKEGMNVSGKLLTLGGKPVVNGRVAIFSTNGGIMYEIRTEADGRFKFQGIRISGTLEFIVEGRTAQNGKNVEVIMDELATLPTPANTRKNTLGNPDLSANIQTYLENAKKQDQLLARSGGLGRAQRLKEVQINAKRSAAEKLTTQSTYTIPEGHSDQTLVLDKPELCGSLALCLLGRVPNLTFLPYKTPDSVFHPLYPYLRTSGVVSKSLVILDGRKLDESEVGDVMTNNMVDPRDIASIDIVRANQSLINYLGGAAILIKTKSQKYRAKRYTPNQASFTIKGFYKARTFYSPKYAGGRDRPSDFRSTVYWNAVVKTDAEGNGQFLYYNAGSLGKYAVIVEGINAAGELGRQVFSYTVK